MTAIMYLIAAATAFCPAAAEVAKIVDAPVRVLPEGTRSYGPAEMCAYQATASPSFMISVSVQPVDPSEDPIEEVKSSAKTLTGSEAERIAVGDGGYAYGSKSKSEAVARKGDRVFHSEIHGIGDSKFKAVGLLKRVVK